MNYTDLAYIPKMGLSEHNRNSKGGRARNQDLTDEVLKRIADNMPKKGITKYLVGCGEQFDKPIHYSTIRSALKSAGLR